MRMTVTYNLDGSQQQNQQYDNLTPEQVAHHLISGGQIWPRHQADTNSKAKFEGADFVTVAINTDYLSVGRILAADFTQLYCTLAVYPAIEQRNSRCILVFALPNFETEARDYVLILEGLKTLYAGALKCHSVLHQWGASGLTDFNVLGGSLNKGAIGYLKVLGVESKQLASTHGTTFLRSRIALDKDTVLNVDGSEYQPTLERVGAGVTVYCPVHYDNRPVAKTHELEDGRLAVVCPCCERTYAQASAERKYDFEHFDRVITELEKADVHLARDNRIVNRSATRYLPELGLPDGILCVKSPKGSGKTEQLENIVFESKERGLSVLLIGHRRSLLKSMSRRLGIECYFTSEADLLASAAIQMADPGKGLVDFGYTQPTHEQVIASVGIKPGQDTEIIKVAPVSHYAICMDSVPELDPAHHRYDVIIIDESEQVFAHLVGDTVKDKRREVYQRLRHYLRMAKSIVLMDADLGMVSMEALFNTGLKSETQTKFWINTPQMKAGTVKMYAAKPQLVNRIHQAVQAGEKCYIAINSKKKAEEIAKALSILHDDLRVVCVHSGNSQSPDIQALLRNIAHEFEHNIDVLVASPSLGTGVDITFKTEAGEPRTVVQHTFGLFEGRITTHMDCDQHLMRVRHPGEVHVWIDPVEQNFETDRDILREHLGGMLNASHALLGFTDEGNPIYAEDDGLIGIWAQVKAASNGSLNQLATLFKKIREDNGWSIGMVELDEDSIKKGSVAMKVGREERVRERNARIISAPKFEKDWNGEKEFKRLYSRMERGLPLADDERARLDRHRIESFYSEEISLDLVEFDTEGHMRKAIRNMQLLLSPRGHEATQDFIEYENNVVGFDRGMCLLKRELLMELFRAAGVFKQGKFTPEAVFEHDSLKRFIRVLEKRSRDMEAAFNVAMRRDANRNRVQQLGDILRVVGLKAKVVSTSETGGKKIRRYGLDEELLVRVVSIAECRLKVTFKIERNHVENELHDQSDQWAHEQEEMAIAA